MDDVVSDERREELEKEKEQKIASVMEHRNRFGRPRGLRSDDAHRVGKALDDAVAEIRLRAETEDDESKTNGWQCLAKYFKERIKVVGTECKYMPRKGYSEWQVSPLSRTAAGA